MGTLVEIFPATRSAIADQMTGLRALHAAMLSKSMTIIVNGENVTAREARILELQITALDAALVEVMGRP